MNDVEFGLPGVTRKCSPWACVASAAFLMRARLAAASPSELGPSKSASKLYSMKSKPNDFRVAACCTILSAWRC